MHSLRNCISCSLHKRVNGLSRISGHFPLPRSQWDITYIAQGCTFILSLREGGREGGKGEGKKEGREEGGMRMGQKGERREGVQWEEWDGERLGSISSDKHSTTTKSKGVWIGREAL